MPETEQTHDLRTAIQHAKRAGASAWFIMVASIRPQAVGLDKNHAADWLMRSTRDRSDPVDTLKSRSETAGDFIGHLWDGDLARALYHADATNMSLLLRTFDNDVLLPVLASERGSVESAERWLSDHEERYGWPDDE
jgi:hypothetical protein